MSQQQIDYILKHFPSIGKSAPTGARKPPKNLAAQQKLIFHQLWHEAHAISLDRVTPDWLSKWESRIPCGECRAHWADIKKANPPVFVDGLMINARTWFIDRHNDVNLLLGKLVFIGNNLPIQPLPDHLL